MYTVNKCVLNIVLNVSYNLVFCKSTSKLFESLGQATLNDLHANVLYLAYGTIRKFSLLLEVLRNPLAQAK